MSIFSKIKVPRPKRTVHNLSYSSKLSLPFGRIVPIMCEKVVPGDKFVHSHEFLLRFAPFIGQVFQSFQTRVEYFYVPSRLLWANFEKFLVDDSQIYSHPYFDLGDLLDGSSDMTGTLVDYFNLPTVNRSSVSPYFSIIDGTGANLQVDALPLAAYIKILLDYYCDENLTTMYVDGDYKPFDEIVEMFEAILNTNGDWSDLIEFYQCLLLGRPVDSETLHDSLLPFRRAYPKDYFTSALPWAQRGPIVQIPLNGSGDVVATINAGGGRQNYTNIFADWQSSPTPSEVNVTLRTCGDLAVSSSTLNSATNTMLDGSSISDGSRNVVIMGGPPEISQQATVDAFKQSPAISFKAVNVNGTATITDLRTAMAVQSWLEKNARAGVRYKEQLLSHFGVRSRDYRLDRAQLLQSSKSTVSIGEVFTTAANDDGTFIPGLGVSTATGSQAVKPFKRYFDEHGYVIGVMTVYPSASYYQGIPKQLMELDKFDYFWPEFQHIGEQEIKNCELFVDDETSANNQKTFGYTPRYAHYKNRTNQVHGDFRTSLMYMHDGRSFVNGPRLNKSFIDIDVERNNLYRVFNYTEESPFYNAYPCYCDFFHNFKAIRPMSYFGTPRIV